MSISTTFRRMLGAVAVSTLLVACSGSAGDGDGESNTEPVITSAGALDVTDVRAAAAAVEAELGGPQDFFEVTTTPQLTNVFVAIDDATAAIPYTYIDGELQAPAPTLEGVEGQTFTFDSIDFDEADVLAGVAADLPDAAIDAFSVEGGGAGFARYVVSARSDQGGVLDIVVAASGAVVEVIPL